MNSKKVFSLKRKAPKPQIQLPLPHKLKLTPQLKQHDTSLHQFKNLHNLSSVISFSTTNLGKNHLTRKVFSQRAFHHYNQQLENSSIQSCKYAFSSSKNSSPTLPANHFTTSHPIPKERLAFKSIHHIHISRRITPNIRSQQIQTNFYPPLFSLSLRSLSYFSQKVRSLTLVSQNRKAKKGLEEFLRSNQDHHHRDGNSPLSLFPLLCFLGITIAKQNKEEEEAERKRTAEYFYSLKAKKQNGQMLEMESLRGKAILILNISTLHEGDEDTFLLILQELHKAYHSAGLEILAFQTDEFPAIRNLPVQIPSFVKLNFSPQRSQPMSEFFKENGLTFHLMAPVKVNGADADPLFVLLKDQLPGVIMKDIYWNYTKFFVSPEGFFVHRLPPAHEADDLAKWVVDIIPKNQEKGPMENK